MFTVITAFAIIQDYTLFVSKQMYTVKSIHYSNQTGEND